MLVPVLASSEFKRAVTYSTDIVQALFQTRNICRCKSACAECTRTDVHLYSVWVSDGLLYLAGQQERAAPDAGWLAGTVAGDVTGSILRCRLGGSLCGQGCAGVLPAWNRLALPETAPQGLRQSFSAYILGFEKDVNIHVERECGRSGLLSALDTLGLLLVSCPQIEYASWRGNAAGLPL